MVQKGAMKVQYIFIDEYIVDHPRHDTKWSSEDSLYRDELGMMQNLSLTKREC
jgi:hypothetical protein